LKSEKKKLKLHSRALHNFSSSIPSRTAEFRGTAEALVDQLLDAARVWATFVTTGIDLDGDKES